MLHVHKYRNYQCGAPCHVFLFLSKNHLIIIKWPFTQNTRQKLELIVYFLDQTTVQLIN